VLHILPDFDTKLEKQQQLGKMLMLDHWNFFILRYFCKDFTC